MWTLMIQVKEVVKMAEIIKVYTEKTVAMRFIGKKYKKIGYWGDWFAKGWFDVIEKAMNEESSPIKDGGYIGLEYRKNQELLEYWIGMFTSQNTEVPEGFSCVDFSEGNLGICWIYGKETEAHKAASKCADKLADSGIKIKVDEEGGVCSFENCVCPRFTTPDDKGNIILDYCYFAL